MHAPPLPEIVMGDSVRFRQIIINLLSNAIKFTHSGSVLLQVYAKPMYHEKQQGFQVMIMVEDTGIGIPPEKQQKIFEPFCQVDASTTREYGGTGLGLTIVHALISAMGGSLQVRSSVGVGTTFTISCWMPISQKKSKTLQYVSLDV